jgi:hypothetical protein
VSGKPYPAILTGILILGAISASAGARLFPAIPGLEGSQRYAVEIHSAGEWKPAFVMVDHARKDGAGATDFPGRSFHWTTFETDESVRIRVSRLSGPSTRVVIRPSRHGIETRKVGDSKVEFTLEPGMKVSVEFDEELKENCYTGAPHGITCVTHPLMIFADPIRPRAAIDGIPEAEILRVPPGEHREMIPVRGLENIRAGKCTLGNATGRRVVVFEKGVHDIGYWQIPEGIDHLHFEAGSYVFGAIDVIPLGQEPWNMDLTKVYKTGWHAERLRHSFRMTGSGVLSGARLPWHLKKNFNYSRNDDWWEHVKLAQFAAEDILVEDVTFANSPYWVLSFINDADRRSKGRFDHIKMVGAWTYNNDGLPVGRDSVVSNSFIHANDDAFKLYHDGGRVSNSVVWQSNNGAVFQFGWFPKSVRNVEVNGVDVIHFENWYGVNQVNRAVFNYADSAGNAEIRDMRFKDVNIEGKILRLFGFKAGGGQKFRDFHFENLHCGGMGAGQIGPPGRNYFIGDVAEFRFKGFTMGGKPVTDGAEAEFDFGNGAGKGFTFAQ